MNISDYFEYIPLSIQNLDLTLDQNDKNFLNNLIKLKYLKTLRFEKIVNSDKVKFKESKNVEKHNLEILEIVQNNGVKLNKNLF